MKIETESLDFANTNTLRHYNRINTKMKKKFNAVEFRDIIYSAHMCGIAEVIQIMLTIAKEIEKGDFEQGDYFDLLKGDMHLLFSTLIREYKKKFPNHTMHLDPDIGKIMETVEKSWSMSLEEEPQEETNSQTTQEAIH